MRFKNTTSLVWIGATTVCSSCAVVVCGASWQSAESAAPDPEGASALPAIPLGLPPMVVPADNPLLRFGPFSVRAATTTPVGPVGALLARSPTDVGLWQLHRVSDARQSPEPPLLRGPAR